MLETATRTEHQLAGIAEHTLHSRGIAFSPDGRVLAVADGKKVRMWEVAARRELPALESHRNEITSLAFTPDSKTLVSGSKDCTALVWDVAAVLPPQQPAEASALFDEMKDSNRLRAYAAFCRLRASPKDALVVLNKQLRPAATVTSRRYGSRGSLKILAARYLKRAIGQARNSPNLVQSWRRRCVKRARTIHRLKPRGASMPSSPLTPIPTGSTTCGASSYWRK